MGLGCESTAWNSFSGSCPVRWGPAGSVCVLCGCDCQSAWALEGVGTIRVRPLFRAGGGSLSAVLWGLLTVRWTVLCGCSCLSDCSRQGRVACAWGCDCHRQLAQCAFTSSFFQVSVSGAGGRPSQVLPPALLLRAPLPEPARTGPKPRFSPPSVRVLLLPDP